MDSRFCATGGETAAWQMCTVVISSALSVKALFVTLRLNKEHDNSTASKLQNYKTSLCCFSGTCRLLRWLLLLCLCQLIDAFFFSKNLLLLKSSSRRWWCYYSWPSCPLKRKVFLNTASRSQTVTRRFSVRAHNPPRALLFI